MAGDLWQENLEASTVANGESDVRARDLRVPGLTLLWHPDPRRIGGRVALAELDSGRQALLSRLTPTFSLAGGGEPLPLADPHLSRGPLILEPGSAPGTVRLLRGGVRSPVLIDGAPLGHGLEIGPADLERGVVLLLAGRVVLLLHRMLQQPVREAQRLGLVGDGGAMAHVRREIRQVADLPIPVLLRGESGSGKELVARALHESGRRRGGPYVAVNMAAIPPSLAAAELFGAVRGAFTGADRGRTGYFGRAQGGTLFLDEIGEAPPEVQVQLLRALEMGEIQPVGAERPVAVDVRIIAATDMDLEAAVEEGRFRSPLLHRLAGVEIHLPPLRSRREDLGQLLVHFLRQELAVAGEPDRLRDPGPRGEPWMPALLAARLAAHPWPGNVRQLRNVARQIVVASRGADQVVITSRLEALLADASAPPAATVRGAADGRPAPPRRTSYRPPSEVTEEELLAALRANRWRLSPTAEGLGISRTSLYTLIDRCPRIRKAADLGRAEIEDALARHQGDLDAIVAELEVSLHGLQIRMTELGIG